MVRLLEILFSVEADFEFNPELHTEALRRIVGNPNSLALTAAGEGGEVVGMLTVQTVVSTATGALSGWVEDVVVHPRWRKKGVASEMLRKVELWADAQGVNRLQLLADGNNTAALDFYASRGWTGSSMIHRKKSL